MSAEEGEGEEEYVELDLEKTLTWTGNAVSIQAGGEFRLPLIVPHPSILAIQFEVEGGNDIEFSLTFQDDQEEASSVVCCLVGACVSTQTWHTVRLTQCDTHAVTCP